MDVSPDTQHSDEIEQLIAHALPRLDLHRTAKFIDCLQRLGVTCCDDLSYLMEDDIVPTLSRIEARKLIMSLKNKGIVKNYDMNLVLSVINIRMQCTSKFSEGKKEKPSLEKMYFPSSLPVSVCMH